MLVALKAVYEMFKSACEAHSYRKTSDGGELARLKEEVDRLQKENKALLAEQAQAIIMIEEMADYLEKH